MLPFSYSSLPTFLALLKEYIENHHWKKGIEFCSRMLSMNNQEKQRVGEMYGSTILDLLRVAVGAGAVKGEKLDMRLHTAWTLIPEFMKGGRQEMKQLHSQAMKDLLESDSYERDISDVCIISVIVGLFGMGMKDMN